MTARAISSYTPESVCHGQLTDLGQGQEGRYTTVRTGGIPRGIGSAPICHDLPPCELGKESLQLTTKVGRVGRSSGLAMGDDVNAVIGRSSSVLQVYYYVLTAWAAVAGGCLCLCACCLFVPVCQAVGSEALQVCRCLGASCDAAKKNLVKAIWGSQRCQIPNFMLQRGPDRRFLLLTSHSYGCTSCSSDAAQPQSRKTRQGSGSSRAADGVNVHWQLLRM